MLERAREVTRNGKYTYIEYARFADDLVILIGAYKRHDWLLGAVDKRLREEFGKLQVGGAQCGKSACCVRRGGDWKRGTVERPAGAPVLDPTCERLRVKFPGPTRQTEKNSA